MSFIRYVYFFACLLHSKQFIIDTPTPSPPPNSNNSIVVIFHHFEPGTDLYIYYLTSNIKTDFYSKQWLQLNWSHSLFWTLSHTNEHTPAHRNTPPVQVLICVTTSHMKNNWILCTSNLIQNYKNVAAACFCMFSIWVHANNSLKHRTCPNEYSCTETVHRRWRSFFVSLHSYS